MASWCSMMICLTKCSVSLTPNKPKSRMKNLKKTKISTMMSFRKSSSQVYSPMRIISLENIRTSSVSQLLQLLRMVSLFREVVMTNSTSINSILKTKNHKELKKRLRILNNPKLSQMSKKLKLNKPKHKQMHRNRLKRHINSFQKILWPNPSKSFHIHKPLISSIFPSIRKICSLWLKTNWSALTLKPLNTKKYR